MRSQCDRLLSRLERGPVDPMVALNELGIYRLAARVFDLNEAGHSIIKQTVSVTNRFGESCRVASYRLEK
mgnify:CR=1 FL=1